MSIAELRELVSSLDDAALAARWPSYGPVEKAALFKLMPVPRALLFFRSLPFEEQYHLILAAPLGSIAPLLEDADPPTRALFHQMTADEAQNLVAIALADSRYDPSPSPLPAGEG